MSDIWLLIGSNQEIQLALLLLGSAIIYATIRRNVRALERLSGRTATEFDDKVVSFVKKLYGYTLFFFALLGSLAIYGVQVTPLLAAGGAVGIVVAMALKETFSDMFSGVMILADRPFAEGDRIQIKKPSGHWGGWGDVKEIGLRRTKVENSDGIIINYPNSELAQSSIINFSDKNDALHPVRVRVRFSVDWSADLEKTVAVATKAIEAGLHKAANPADGGRPLKISEVSRSLSVPVTAQSPKGIKDTTPVVLVRSIWSDSLGVITPGVLLEGRYFLSDVRDRTNVRSLVLTELLTSLQLAEIPLPTAGPAIHYPPPP